MKKLTYLLLLLSQLGLAQSGKVGINTNSPTAALHVQGGDVLFNGLSNLPGSPANPPASGAGTRFMWYPDKGALRVGNVSGTHWDKDSIGVFSIAMGTNTKAKGYGSFALGYEAQTSLLGWNSYSIGSYTMTRGGYSTAIGLGAFTADTALYSAAFGFYTGTGGEYSTSVGSGNFAAGDYSSVFGISNYAGGYYSTAIGNNSVASGQYALAIGSNAYASGNYSLAVGQGGNAGGDYSTKLGNYNTASGYGSMAMGNNSTAAGRYSITLGNTTKSNGYTGLVIGIYNDTLVAPQTAVTSTTPLFIIGNGDNINAPSNAFVVRKDGNVGIGNVNPQFGLHVVNNDNGSGGWEKGIVIENTAPANNPGEAALSWRNAIFPVGKQWIMGINQSLPSLVYSYGTNLTATNTKMTLDTLGNLGLGTGSPAFRLHIVNNDNGSGGWTQGLNIQNVSADTVPGEVAVSFRNNALPVNKYWMIGINESAAGLSFNYGTQLVAGNTRMYIDSSGDVGIGTTSPDFKLEVNGTAGKPGGGPWSAPSDFRLKKEIHPYTDGLQTLLKINPVRYHYNELTGFDTQPEYVGVIAQELQKVAPYMVSVSDKKMTDGSSGYLMVDNSAMTYMLINAVKEQQKEIDDLDKELSSLLSQLSAELTQKD